MPLPAERFKWSSGLSAWASRSTFSASIVGITAVYLAIGLIAFMGWRVTGNDAWIEAYFQVPGPLALIALAAAGFLFSRRVLFEFSPGQPMRKAWKLICFSAGCDLAAAVIVQVISLKTPLNPLQHMDWWSGQMASSLREFGLVIGGTLRFAFLAAGLFQVLRVYRASGFLGRLAAIDWILLAGVGAYVVREAWDLVVALQHGKHPSSAEIMSWPTDPLLWLLLAESMLLYRSVREMGPGWIGRCWKAFSFGIALVVVGDMTIWATSYGFLPWPWSSIGWYIWLPAAAAFAIAPAYQLEAIAQVYTGRGRHLLSFPD